jgi:hypothetical protein
MPLPPACHFIRLSSIYSTEHVSAHVAVVHKVTLRYVFLEFLGFPCPYHSTVTVHTHISSGDEQ